MVDLIPSADSVMQILESTGAYRQGHFVYRTGKHASHYFQMPLAFRYYNNARYMSVGLSRMFRIEKQIASRLPKVSIISPSPGGIMVAFGVREALSAEQIYWAEFEQGQRQFRQYIGEGDVHPAIIVDDIMRSGRAMRETIDIVRDLGADIIGLGAIVRFEDAPAEFDGIPVKSLLTFDCPLFDSEEEWRAAGNSAPTEMQEVR